MSTPCRCLHIQDSTTLLQKNTYSSKLIDPSYIYEKTFICKLMEEGNIEYISKLGTIFPYQDDLINFGNSNIANDILNNIYPKDTIIKNTNLSSNNVTYLDLGHYCERRSISL